MRKNRIWNTALWIIFLSAILTIMAV